MDCVKHGERRIRYAERRSATPDIRRLDARELSQDGFARFEAVHVQPRPFIGCLCVGSFLTWSCRFSRPRESVVGEAVGVKRELRQVYADVFRPVA